MCYHIYSKSTLAGLKKAFHLESLSEAAFEPAGRVSGFSHPLLPVVTAKRPEVLQLMEWGLIPPWAREDRADELARQCLNARSEGVFERPSFKGSIEKQRCLLLVDGFFEWRHEGKKKIPYLITAPDGRPFGLGSLYAVYEGVPRFGIITVPANETMAYVHNTKERMPLMLAGHQAEKWLQPELTRPEIEALMQPIADDQMKAEVVQEEK